MFADGTYMSVTFVQLNHGWNAEPNAPSPEVIVQGNDVLLTFFVNAFQFENFTPDERGAWRLRAEPIPGHPMHRPLRFIHESVLDIFPKPQRPG